MAYKIDGSKIAQNQQVIQKKDQKPAPKVGAKTKKPAAKQVKPNAAAKKGTEIAPSARMQRKPRAGY